jgi:signal transduction histidine kinase
MSSLDTIYQKMTPGTDATAQTSRFQPAAPPPAAEGSRQISRDVAHELNNVLTIVRGYADRLLLKHGDNPALRPELQLISDNARRAANVVRTASQPKPPAAIII